jgi:hypothetical protein
MSWALFSEDVCPYAPNGRIQAEHMDGRGRIASLREGESPFCQVRKGKKKKKKKKGRGLLVGRFFIPP